MGVLNNTSFSILQVAASLRASFDAASSFALSGLAPVRIAHFLAEPLGVGDNP